MTKGGLKNPETTGRWMPPRPACLKNQGQEGPLLEPREGWDGVGGGGPGQELWPSRRALPQHLQPNSGVAGKKDPNPSLLPPSSLLPVSPTRQTKLEATGRGTLIPSTGVSLLRHRAEQRRGNPKSEGDKQNNSLLDLNFHPVRFPRSLRRRRQLAQGQVAS